MLGWCSTCPAAGSFLRPAKPALTSDVWQKWAELIAGEGAALFVASINPEHG